MPKELWKEFHNIVQKVGSKPSLRKRNTRRQKWLSEEVLQTAEKRRDMKDKGEKESISI